MFRPYRTAPLCAAAFVGSVSVIAAAGCSDGGDAGTDADVPPAADAGDGDDGVCDAPYVNCAVFVDQIMPAFQDANCLGVGCHAQETSTADFGLYTDVDPDSPEMAENFRSVHGLIDLNEPDLSPIYRRSIDNHAAVTLPDEDAEALLAWIEDAAETAADSGEPPPSGVDVSQFNVGVFRDEVFPILDGRDLNTDEVREVGCTSPACHGEGGGAVNFILDPSREAEQNLESFANFVNLNNPVRSQALLCAQNLPGCRVDHPGGAYFENANDLNYQRVIAYIYASANNSPLDFAFFAERIQPIFNDDDFTVDNQTNCQDAGCHGVEFPGQRPGNNTNFPILRIVDPNDIQGLTENFVNATAFTNFLDPESSSLFLFPTNQIAHRPGAVIDINNNADHAEFVDEILLRWIGGLRPDGQGFGRHFLLAGPYNIEDLNQSTAIDEVNGLPRYRDPTEAINDNRGWLEEFTQEEDPDDPDDAFIDLDARFGNIRANAPRAAYASVYLINADSFPLDVRLEVESDNDIHVYFGDQDQDRRDGGDVVLTQRIEPFSGGDGDLVRILIKVFEPVDQDDFGFTARFFDNDRNVPLTDETGELVFVLGPEGGI